MAKPDDRSDNVEKLQGMVQNTIQNMEESVSTLNNTDLSQAEKEAIQNKNKRRLEAVESFREEIKDEWHDRHNR